MDTNTLTMTLTPAKTILAVLLLHVYADFNFQIGSRLNEFKERNWWISAIRKAFQKKSDRVAASLKYGNDYIAGLALHAFSWSVITFVPLILSASVSGEGAVALVVANSMAHAAIDHWKCNRMSINLWEDQILHLIQIFVTLAVFL